MTSSPSEVLTVPGARRLITRHALALIVFVLLLAITAAASVAVRDVIRGQEKRLLAERTVEISSALTSSTSSLRSELRSAGTAASVDGPASPLFKLDASALTLTGATVAVAQLRSGTFVVFAAQGKRSATGAPLGAAQDQLARRALTSTDFVSVLSTDTTGVHLLLALKIDGALPTVAYLDTPLAPTKAVPTTKDSPYRELNVAIFATRSSDPKQLVIQSGSDPTSAHRTASHALAFGADTWLVLVSARVPLVGTFAANFSWTVLIGGAVLSLLIALLIEILARRRAYALSLVEQRTRTLRQAQEAADTANRAKSQFISRMSHELRTPLNAVLGFGQLLELDDLTPEQDQAVNQITRGGRHLLDLINEILDISQVEAGQMSLSPEAVSVGELLHDTVELLRPLASGRDVQLYASDADHCHKFVFADRQRLKQVLLNVIGNGIKYNRQGGSVSITCAEAAPGRLRILVTDTGAGIDPVHLPMLFMPFERLGAEQTTIEGTGIGLALSRRLAEAMGGTLEVESVVGRGSTFSIELPLVEGPVDRYHRLDNPGVNSAPAAGAITRQAILHIEDNLSNVKLIEQVLTQRRDIELIAAMQGRIGLELAREHRPMLILLDLNLPDLDGEEVLTLLRDDPRTARIPVVIVSADATPRQVQRLLATGASAYLTKPIDVRELLRVIDAAAAAHTDAVATAGHTT